MEYNKFFPWVTQYYDRDYRDNEGFMEYLETENVLEQYAVMLLAVLPPPCRVAR